MGFEEASATKDEVMEEEAAQAEGLSEGTNTMSFFFTIGQFIVYYREALETYKDEVIEDAAEKAAQAEGIINTISVPHLEVVSS